MVVDAPVVVGATVVVVTTSFVKASSGTTISTLSSALSTTIERVVESVPPPEQPANKANATRACTIIVRIRVAGTGPSVGTGSEYPYIGPPVLTVS